MGTYSAQLEIEAPPVDLWPLVGDLERHPEWAMDDIAIERMGSDRYTSRVTTGDKSHTATIQVLSSRPEELFEFRVRDETGTYMHRIGLAELPIGTLVSRQVTPTAISLGHRVLSTAARSPIRIPSLHGSLRKLADLVVVSS